MGIFEYSLEGKRLVFLFMCVHLSSSILSFPHSLVVEDRFLNIINEVFFLSKDISILPYLNTSGNGFIVAFQFKR